MPTNTPNDTPPSESTSDSSEGIIGIGVTIGAIGVLFLLLGWAQSMREVPAAAMILCIIGAVFVVGGIVVAASGKSRKSR
jgi:hypothetical protein